MRRGVPILVSLVALAGRARAGSKTEVLPCRPTIACTARIEAPGVLVMEAGYLRKDLPGAAQHSVPFLLKLSLDDWLQLQFGSNGPTFSAAPISQRFQDDLTLGAKLRLFHTSETTLSASATASVPIPARQTGYLQTYDLLVAALLSQELPLDITADFNLGLDAWRLERSPLLQPWAALSLNHALPIQPDRNDGDLSLPLGGPRRGARRRRALRIGVAGFRLARARRWRRLRPVPRRARSSIFAGFTLAAAHLRSE